MLGSDKPFFTDDLTGFAKLIGIFLTTCATVSYGAWRMLNSSLTKHVDKLDEKVDYGFANVDNRLSTDGDIGREIETTKNRRSEIDERLNDLKMKQGLLDNNLRGLDETFTQARDRMDQYMRQTSDRDQRLMRGMAKLGERMASLEATIAATVGLRVTDLSKNRREDDD